MGVRLAFIGKGGAGKSVVSSTMARLLARRGHKVLAADMDRSPGLTWSIGMRAADVAMPIEVLEQSDLASPYGWHLRPDILPREVVERYTVTGPDGVRVTSFGKITTVDKESAKQTMVALIQLLFGFGEPDWHVIADLEAGPTEPFERYHAFSDDVWVVVGPAWRSAMTARRLLPMVGEGRTATIVANRFRDEPDHPGLAPAVRIPFDPDVAEAERQGLSPLDECPTPPRSGRSSRRWTGWFPGRAARPRRFSRGIRRFPTGDDPLGVPAAGPPRTPFLLRDPQSSFRLRDPPRRRSGCGTPPHAVRPAGPL